MWIVAILIAVTLAKRHPRYGTRCFNNDPDGVSTYTTSGRYWWWCNIWWGSHQHWHLKCRTRRASMYCNNIRIAVVCNGLSCNHHWCCDICNWCCRIGPTTTQWYLLYGWFLQLRCGVIIKICPFWSMYWSSVSTLHKVRLFGCDPRGMVDRYISNLWRRFAFPKNKYVGLGDVIQLGSLGVMISPIKWNKDLAYAKTVTSVQLGQQWAYTSAHGVSRRKRIQKDTSAPKRMVYPHGGTIMFGEMMGRKGSKNGIQNKESNLFTKSRESASSGSPRRSFGMVEDHAIGVWEYGSAQVHLRSGGCSRVTLTKEAFVGLKEQRHWYSLYKRLCYSEKTSIMAFDVEKIFAVSRR